MFTGRRTARHPTLTQRIPLASLESEHTPAMPMTMTLARRRRRSRCGRCTSVRPAKNVNRDDFELMRWQGAPVVERAGTELCECSEACWVSRWVRSHG